MANLNKETLAIMKWRKQVYKTTPALDKKFILGVIKIKGITTEDLKNVDNINVGTYYNMPDNVNKAKAYTEKKTGAWLNNCKAYLAKQKKA